MTLRTGQRAVTAGDYERLTLESSIEVARARCLPAARGNGSVRLLVVPQVRGDASQHKLDDFAIAQPLMRRITDHLDEHRVVGTSGRGQHAVLPGRVGRRARSTPGRAGRPAWSGSARSRR